MSINKYAASSATVFAAAAGTAPFFLFEGSATKTIRLRKIRVDGPTLTAVEYLHVVLTKYSSAASGGTSASLVQIPLDSVSSAGTANVIKQYTVAPTAGTAVGTVDATRLLGQATTPAAAGIPHTELEFTFNDKGLVLRGVAEGIGMRFSAAPASAVTLSVAVEWEEE